MGRGTRPHAALVPSSLSLCSWAVPDQTPRLQGRPPFTAGHACHSRSPPGYPSVSSAFGVPCRWPRPALLPQRPHSRKHRIRPVSLPATTESSSGASVLGAQSPCPGVSCGSSCEHSSYVDADLVPCLTRTLGHHRSCLNSDSGLPADVLPASSLHRALLKR